MIQRWDLTSEAEEWDSGEWCKYEDVAQLEQANEKIVQANETLVAAIEALSNKVKEQAMEITARKAENIRLHNCFKPDF